MKSAALWEPGDIGCFVGLPDDVYHSAPGVSQSQLKLTARSPRHFLEALITPRKPSPELMMGTLTHHMLLQPDAPLPQFAVRPEGFVGTSTEGRAWLKAQREAGVVVLDRDEWDRTLGMVKAIGEHPHVGPMIRSGTPEVSLFWEARATSVPHRPLLCKARLDVVPSGNALIDIKTVHSDARQFAETIIEHGYDVQFGSYGAAWNLLNPDDKRNAFVAVVVEKQPPHGVIAFNISPRVLQRGREGYAKLLDRYAEILEAGQYPGYTTEFVPLDLPEWAYR